MERSESRWRDEGKGEAIPFQIPDNAEGFVAGPLMCWLGALDDDVVFNSQFTINRGVYSIRIFIDFFEV